MGYIKCENATYTSRVWCMQSLAAELDAGEPRVLVRFVCLAEALWKCDRAWMKRDWGQTIRRCRLL